MTAAEKKAAIKAANALLFEACRDPLAHVRDHDGNGSWCAVFNRDDAGVAGGFLISGFHATPWGAADEAATFLDSAVELFRMREGDADKGELSEKWPRHRQLLECIEAIALDDRDEPDDYPSVWLTESEFNELAEKAPDDPKPGDVYRIPDQDNAGEFFRVTVLAEQTDARVYRKRHERIDKTRFLWLDSGMQLHILREGASRTICGYLAEEMKLHTGTVDQVLCPVCVNRASEINNRVAGTLHINDSDPEIR